MELMKVENGMVDSLEICRQINIFREKEGKKELRHDTLRGIIKDEFEEEINTQEILDIKKKGKTRDFKVFNLTISQAKQVLVRESKFVRKLQE